MDNYNTLGIALLIYFGLCAVLAHYLGSKKRLGFGWSLFWLFFFSLVIGGIAIIQSPSRDNLPPPEPRSKSLNIFLGSFLAIGAIYLAYKIYMSSNDFDTSDTSLIRKILFQIGLIGGSIYFFIRYKRHEKIYDELHYI